jgi:hypothetical protein
MLIRVAPIHSAAGTPEHRLDEIRQGQHLDYFYVHGDGVRLRDQIVNLAAEQPVPAGLLWGLTKIARLADWQWRALLVHLAVSRFHQEPETLFREEVLSRREPHAS